MSPNKQREPALGAREVTSPTSAPRPDDPSPPANALLSPPPHPAVRPLTEAPPSVVTTAPPLNPKGAQAPPQNAPQPASSTPGAPLVTVPAVSASPPVSRTSKWLVATAISALFMSMVAVAGIGVGVYHYRSTLEKTTPVDDDDGGSSTKRAGLPAEDDEDEDEDEVAPSLDDVLQETTATVRGGVDVVDVGVRAAKLRDVLLAQRIVADTKEQQLILMLSGRACDPCRDFDDALDDPKMQEALAGVRLVRVDLDVFRDELKRLDLPTHLYPAFFLLADDLRPIDAIHGGEWDADIAANMAPVLRSFVRREPTTRRHPEWAPTTSSIPL